MMGEFPTGIINILFYSFICVWCTPRGHISVKWKISDVLYLWISLFQGQRREQSRQSRPYWRRWARWQTSFPPWASAGGREDLHTPSLSKTCTGWAHTRCCCTMKRWFLFSSRRVSSLFVAPQVIETLLFSTFVSWKAFFPLVRDDTSSTYTFITGKSSSSFVYATLVHNHGTTKCLCTSLPCALP